MTTTIPPPAANIPVDLVTSEILPRLPVKTLVRFSAVCKSWYSLIRNPDFVNANLRLNLSKPRPRCFLFPCYCSRFADVNRCDCNLYSNDSWFIACEDKNAAGPPKVHELGFRLCNMMFIGSCKGLISLYLRSCNSWGVFLYNPSLRILKTVEKFREKYFPFCAFGYNERNNDHRLMRVRNKITKDGMHDQVDIYSLRTDSWHEIQQVPSRTRHYRRNPGMYYNGSTYWLNWSGSIKFGNPGGVLTMIVSFDFDQENFKYAILPRELQVGYGRVIDISEFEGSVALFVDAEDEGERNTYYLWVMKDDGAEQSWIKRHKFYFPCHVPRELFRDGTIVLLMRCQGNLTTVFHRFENEKLEFKDFGKFTCETRIDDFAESLLLLGSKNDLCYCLDALIYNNQEV